MEMSDEMYEGITQALKQIGLIDDRELDLWTYRVKEDDRLLVTAYENSDGDTITEIYLSPWKDMLERIISLIGVPVEAIEVSCVKAVEATMSILPWIKSGEISMCRPEEKNWVIEALIGLDRERYGHYARQLVDIPMDTEEPGEAHSV